MELLLTYTPLLLKGTALTIAVGLTSLVISVVLGLLGAWGKLSRSPAAQGIAKTYTTIVRGIPDIVLMLLLFYGGQQIINQIGDYFGWGYIEIDAFTAGVSTIGFIFGAYMTETFRGAYLAIPAGQVEAGMACGMSRWTVFRRIIWPQLVRFALPSFGNNWLVMIKTTALVSIIGLQDVVYLANAAGKSTRQPFTFLFGVLIIYLILTSVSNAGLNWLERRYNTGYERN